ncbi:hypothetical protein CCACVL1_23193 [Corchorus capsularis]|uniref:Uncharacterized protein n=1 Tax=Corchorus capsularis TaxID=210143 RepID=A0A1R3GV17_COCAP|nr:hypothetical protein CCACVL1_23193 [Corchorus capsularis]
MGGYSDGSQKAQGARRAWWWGGNGV